jgi:inositol-phosphate phosphatase/L-galactose 1-phosphate phosphatase/histidinol-phosphatase
LQAALEQTTIDFALSLADTAGEVVRRHFRTTLPASQKADKSPVTAADREVETAIRARIEQQFPDHGIFGEEHGRKNESSPWQWVIDPIDGTRAFIAGYRTFTTLIALVKDNVPLMGIIDQAVNGERWLASPNQPTTYNGQRVYTRKIKKMEEAVVATTSMPYYFNKEQSATFEYVKHHCAHVVQGGDAYGYAMLASGHIDLFLDTGLKPYDLCALKPVVENAGGVITDWNGKPLTLHSDGHIIAAATPELHHQAMALLLTTVT